MYKKYEFLTFNNLIRQKLNLKQYFRFSKSIMARLFIPFLLFFIVELYTFFALRTLTKNKMVLVAYWLLFVVVCLIIVYNMYIVYNENRFSLNTGYAIALMLTYFVPKVIVFFFLFAEDIFRFFAGIANYFSLDSRSVSEAIPSRRKFISQVALGIAAIPFAGFLYGVFKGKYDFRVITQPIEFDDLPDAFDGYRITQISDIHSGSFDNFEKIKYAVNLINEQQSDAIFFTGDMVNNKASEMDPWKVLFGSFKAKDGVFSILGNHDYGDYVDWANEKEKAENLLNLKNIQKEMGYDLLLNEHRSIQRGKDSIKIVGVENWGAGGFVKHGDIEKASEGLSERDFKILLSHDPSYWQQNIKSNPKNFQLTLSGHTHGMQFGIEIPGWIKWSPAKWRYKYWAGLYEQNKQIINVNRGFGYLAFPGRVGIWPEITVITLKAKDA